MPQSMSRAREEAFKNLKLDAGFFQKVLRRDCAGLSQDTEDFDIYLMERNVMPVVMQGLDALSRHVDKLTNTGGLCGGGRAPFNPLIWLAQYLLRNHPAHVRDHRTPMYQHFTELARIERGRRCLLRRRPAIEEEYYQLEKQMRSVRPLGLEDLPGFLQHLDDKWGLQGQFCQKMPQDFTGLLQVPAGKKLLFLDFWLWFEAFVLESDLVRASVFEEVERKRQEAELEAQKAEEVMLRRERALQQVQEQRKSQGEHFEAVSADMYINEEIGRIINKGAILEAEEKPGAPPLKGEHAALIRALLELWGCQPGGEAKDAWDEHARKAWKNWVDEYCPAASPERVESVSLRQLMDRDAFEEFLLQTYTYHASEGDEAEIHHTVEVKGIVEDSLDTIAEALDEETGQILQISLLESQVPEVRRRLAEQGKGGVGPLLARVDAVSNRITEILPAPGGSAEP